jgi:lipoprotein-anchoring transpeptidase ErfK/SrfK
MLRRRITLLSSGLVALSLFSAACSGCGETRATPTGPAGSSTTSAVELDGGPIDGPLVYVDAGDAAVPYEGPYLYALFMMTPVMSEMAFPTKEQDEKRRNNKPDKAAPIRLGYLRQGAKVPVIAEPHKTTSCPEGWYELFYGGFVCGRYATLDANHPRVKAGPHTPWFDQPLPYQYAYNVAHGTPLYRTIPSKEERLTFEPWLVKKPKLDTNNPYDDMLIDAGLSSVSGDPSLDDDAGIPWYLRDWDGGKPQVTLDDLKGDGPIVRRMVKGFYVALDSEYEEPTQKTKWWKTTGGFLAPKDRMFLPKAPTDFHGVWLGVDNPPPWPPAIAQPDGGTPAYWIPNPPTKLPVAFLLNSKAKKYTLSEDHKKATAGDPIARFTPVGLTGTTVNIGAMTYMETVDGWWLRHLDGVAVKPGAAPSDLAPGEKWIDVSLSTQSLVAFVGDKPVYATLVSTGKVDKVNKEKNHETPKGSFRIREKHVAATMDGDVASDGPYSIEDVPWIMYFNGSYALHGAFWHSNFGHTQSHGCVNLAPDDARALFNWTEPKLPEGWHGVWATDAHPGTRVIVHD